MGFRKVKINDIAPYDITYKSMAIPSTIHSYSVCLEYLRKWFLSKFDSNFFGENNENFYISGRHAFDDFRRTSIASMQSAPKEKLLKEVNTSASLNCVVDLNYDRDKVDLYPYGMELFLQRHSTAESAFFKDDRNNILISQVFEIMPVEANFKITFNTRAQQFDMYKYCIMKFRVGATQGEYIDYDQHVPYSLMRQIAIDAGFEVANRKIVDVISFLKYLNMNSTTPFLYKYRNINGKDEFFLRIKNVYVHIAIPEIDHDDGEREGQANTDYSITFTANVRFPITKCYVYCSMNKHSQITLKEDIENIACFTTIRMLDAPDYNEKGWKKIFSTEWEDDKVTDKSTVIDLSEHIMVGELGKVIRYTTNINLNPELFMDIKFFNNGITVPFDINWYTGKCVSANPLPTTRTTIVVYTDMDYVNSQKLVLDSITNRGRV